MFSLVPFRGKSAVRRDPWNVGSFFEDFFSEPMVPAFYRSDRQMKVDIREDEANYVVEADLPGVAKEEISLELADDVLTISVNHKEEVNEEQKNYIRKERYTVSMCRAFAVDNIIPDQVNAKFENGVLEVKLPKKEETQSENKNRMISID